MLRKAVKYGNKVVGRLEGDVFRKRVRRDVHFFRLLGGYAIQAAVLRSLLERGVKHVEIEEKDTGNRFRTELRAYLDHGIPFDAGFGEQVVLPLDRFKLVDDPQQRLPL